MIHVKLALKNVLLPWQGWAGLPSLALLTPSLWEAMPWWLHTRERPGRVLQGGGDASQFPELSPASWGPAALAVSFPHCCLRRAFAHTFPEESEKHFQQADQPAGRTEAKVRLAGRRQSWEYERREEARL